MKDIEITNQGEEHRNLPSKYSLEDMKSFFYLLNGKPDTSVQLLKGRKKVSIAEIRDLNERIQRKLENHNLIAQIASINLIFEKGKIQDYGSWAEFERETWHTINNITEVISLTWDISIKLPKYENPQRHTLKVKIGRSISPKDMLDLVFSSDNIGELIEQRADGVVKVDFIDQVIAGELIEKVTNWYDGLQNIPDETGLQKFFENYQSLIIGSINNFTPIFLLSLYHFYFTSFCNWSNYTNNITLANIQLLLISLLTVFFIGSMLGRRFAKWTDGKIDDYETLRQFSITKGDENSLSQSQLNNKSVSNTLLSKGGLAIFSAVIAFAVKYLLEH